MSERIYIDRPPRIQPELPYDQVEIPAPPDRAEKGWAQLVQFLLPLITIVGYILVSSVGGSGRSPWLLIPIALSVVASSLFSVYSARKDRMEAEEKNRRYKERISDLSKEMNNQHDLQRRFYRYNYPDRSTIFRIVQNARQGAESQDRTLRAEARLYERRVSDEDFGVVRLGMGTLPSTVIYTLKELDDPDDPRAREAQKLANDSMYVSDTPVIISLRNPDPDSPEDDDERDDDEPGATTPRTHALGIAGAKPDVYEFIRSFATNFLVFHAPGDARLFVLAKERQEWAWAEQIPHSQKDEQTGYLCFLDEIEDDPADAAFDEEDTGALGEFLEGIRKLLATRKIKLADKDGEGKGNPRLPFLLVLVDMLDTTYDPDSPLKDIESEPATSILIEEGEMLGAAVVFLVPERTKVPSGCTAVIEIERTTPATNSRLLKESQLLHFRYAEVGVNTPRYVGKADAITRPENMTALAQQLSSMDVRQGYGANLASGVLFLDLMQQPSLDALLEDAWEKWQLSEQEEHANWLRCKLGLLAGNKPRTLVFSAKRDGVHGMVAGSTGSGKSELMITMIASMAVTYAPTVLNFVLVDYKGGGAFKGLQDMPHVVDIITNLEGEAVTRMFTAITSEMQRRQALNSETGTKNIVEYRQKGLHETHSPYPFLFIIVDEFAEMIADRSEYKSELESITRVGRAQGVSLILAAQRPSGVTDQMRSNIKFRISLRVETPGESREMLRRGDAAFLPSIPGRGYLQVGNEEIELIQVAYTGEKYVAPGTGGKAAVIWPDRGDTYDEREDEEPPELYKVIVDRLDEMASGRGIPQQHAPWPEFLPLNIALSQLLVSKDPKAKAITAERYLANVNEIMLGQTPDETLTLNPSVNKWLNGENGWLSNEQMQWEKYAMRPVVGLVDNPYGAQQMPLTVHLPRGHVAIFGASGWGKTAFIRSLVVSLAASHSPNHFHAYILDLGGRNLGVLENLPHVGSVITPDEEGYEERVEQMLRELNGIIESRKTTLSNADVPDVYRYNQQHPRTPLPTVLVAVDNFIEFRETFGEGNDNVESTLDKFVELVRQGKPYGVHFVVTATQLNILSNQLFSLFTERLTLKLADRTEYRSIVGGNVADIGEIPGRGYIKIGRFPLSFQIALPIDLTKGGIEEAANENKELAQLAQTMQYYMDVIDEEYNLPSKIDALPKTILYKQILARQLEAELDESFLDVLTADAKRRWDKSLSADDADWLRATVGVISGNRLRDMHFEAKVDGVHGMIAGGTGSGKSELLMTLIVDLALNHHPDILNFVLVDYKGGGAFKPLEGLPHVVDSITNLNKSAVKRMFTAINAEMQRRQKLNADTGTKDIVEYRKKGLHLSKEPYPHLFIIIDEYAEMITDSPEFKDELESITRVGRAQGVNLLLASQRPVGVTDQMRANIKFRICLRVEGIDTSREMLRRSDAAFLPSGMPGRGYLQIGNENIELIQMAYTGETYPYAEVPEGGKKPKFYDVIVQMTHDLLKSERPRTPWPPFLPTKLTLSDSMVEAYMPDDPGNYRELFNMSKRGEKLFVNPAIGEWFDGKMAWRGMNWNRTAMRPIMGLADDPFAAEQNPLVVDLTKGHVVLFGSSGWGKTTFMRTMIVSLAATHSPDEFQTHVLDLGGRNLEVLKALPHVGSIIMPDERGYEERVQQILRELNDIVDQRKRLFSEVGVSTLYEYNSDYPDRALPAILFIIDNFAEFVETFGGEDEDSMLEVLILLVRQAKAYGLHFVISATRLNELNSKLYSLFTERLTLRLSDSGSYRAIVGGKIGEIDEIPGRGFFKVGRRPLEFQIGVAVGRFDEQGQIKEEAAQIRELGRIMHEVGKSAWSGNEPLRIDALPKTSSYRQLISEVLKISTENTFLDELEESTRKVWAANDSPEEADWLKVILGITSGNRKRELQLEAKKDGVHGLVAGGTGSGKSEMLMTMIIGLALNYSPKILNFVLVDYKGGGAFKPFETLPHVVDIVTNLNKAAVHRMFAAINAEMRRRQRMNVETGTKDIVEYRKRGFHLTHESYPHLFIIIDEYAEMIDDNPDFRGELESITRVGRAQGVNLILASQRPKGVTDQMRANIKLRICLRVEQQETSRELLRKPDAALLPNGMPGRGYIQIGNENLELIQVSWTGENQPDERERPLLWPDRPELDVVGDSDDVPKVFDQVVSIASKLEDFKMAPKPWPSFLPTQFSLQSKIFDAKKGEYFTLTTAVSDWLNEDTDGLWPGVDWRSSAMRAVAGLVDNPVEAHQGPLVFDLSRTHLAIFGDSGWGKTSMLRTLIVSLASTHTPNEFQAYVLDLGGRNFRAIETLPHVGAVIYADEEAYEERLQRLLDRLGQIVDERQQIVSNADASNLFEYNEKNPDDILPAILVAIDNFAELRENYEALVENTIMPLVRRSLSAGIVFVVATNIPGNIPSKLNNLFGERITFKQANKDRYMDIVGRGAIEIDDIPGLGYIKVGKRPLLYHAALPVGIFDAENGRDTRNEPDELRLLAGNMRDYITADSDTDYTLPTPIEILPELVPLTEMLDEAPEPRGSRVQAIIGKNSQLQPAMFNLKRVGPHFAIVGPPLSGKTTALYSYLFSLTERHSPEQVQIVLIDLQQKFVDYDGERKITDLPHVLMYVTELEQIPTMVENLKTECAVMANDGKNRELFVIIDNFDDLNEEIEQRERDAARDFAGLARRYGRDGFHIVIAGTLDSGISEIRRRVLASNYGIGLRSAQSLDTLRVSRRPPALRGKELPVGRGFIVRSGQAQMIQIAAPYEGMGIPPVTGDYEEEEERIAQTLDIWVQRIVDLYPDARAEWSAPLPVEEGAEGEVEAETPTSPIVSVLRRILYKESENGKEEILEWNDTDVLMKFVKDALEKETGLEADFFGTSWDQVLDAAKDYFPEVSTNGTAQGEAEKS